MRRRWRGIGLPREYAGSRLVGRARKRWIDTVKECLKKRVGCQANKENGSGWE